MPIKTERILAIAFLAFVLASSPMRLGSQDQQSANPVSTGNDLLRICQSSDLYDRGVCGGYLAAVSQVVEVANRACYPEGVTIEHGKDVVVRYLKEHPESRDHVAVTLATKALTAAFPCNDNR
jgi:hypothetical protein